MENIDKKEQENQERIVLSQKNKKELVDMILEGKKEIRELKIDYRQEVNELGDATEQIEALNEQLFEAGEQFVKVESLDDGMKLNELRKLMDLTLPEIQQIINLYINKNNYGKKRFKNRR